MATVTPSNTDDESIVNQDEPILRASINWMTNDLSEGAKAQFTFFNEILNIFQLDCRDILGNEKLTAKGRHLFLETTARYFQSAKHVLNHLAAHPEIMGKDNPLPHPVVICSLPRTGTTLLYNLLACDPATRAPYLPEIMEPIPPIPRHDIEGHSRKSAALAAFDELWQNPDMIDHAKEILASHPSFASEEDSFIFLHVGIDWINFWLAQSTKSELATWFLDETNKDVAYEYHKLFIKMLNSVDSPRSHWLFKTSMHGFYLNTFLKYYPTASLIMVHRRLEDVLPSWIRFGNVVSGCYLNANNDETMAAENMVTKHCISAIDHLARRFVQFRRTNQHIPVCDIFYEDLMAEPIETVRVIYQKFGLTWSIEFEECMKKWLADNPQGKQGRNTYTTKDFGLTAESINERYREYNDMFFKSREIIGKRDSGTV